MYLTCLLIFTFPVTLSSPRYPLNPFELLNAVVKTQIQARYDKYLYKLTNFLLIHGKAEVNWSDDMQLRNFHPQRKLMEEVNQFKPDQFFSGTVFPEYHC